MIWTLIRVTYFKALLIHLPVGSANADLDAEERQTTNKMNAIKSDLTIAKH